MFGERVTVSAYAFFWFVGALALWFVLAKTGSSLTETFFPSVGRGIVIVCLFYVSLTPFANYWSLARAASDPADFGDNVEVTRVWMCAVGGWTVRHE